MTAQPRARTLEELRREAASCTACDLYARATQTVFGEGPEHAEVMLVGEQPGDREDKQGHPFVGPAGRILDEALALAGIARDRVYLTNAVKHFKWREKGKRRIHEAPSVAEIRACKPWLDAEVAAVDPRVIVPMGATAVRAVIGPGFKVTEHRGEPLDLPDGRRAVATVHPSSVVRIEDSAQRSLELHRLAGDLAVAARLVGA
ncbi:MAG TPA: UdgX family uracil-DNA binding protein [Candidatus Dormibacteraeota bacterium]|jgi:DNA polymerase|nr:UdgX family uracil-DNA binding protein [Candidatus Dormibacteraeota bacterium]